MVYSPNQRMVVTGLTMLWVTILFCLVKADEIPFEKSDRLPEVKAKIKANGYSFTVKDYGDHFYNKIKLNRRHRAERSRQMRSMPVKPLPVAKRALPAAFDIRDIDGKAYIQPPQDQAELGSCYAFGACATAEAAYNRTFDLYNDDCVDFSESYIAWNLGSLEPYNQHFYGGEGADYEYAELLALTTNGPQTGYEGICLEKDYPYQTEAPSSDVIEEGWHNARVTFNNWFRIYPDAYEDTTEQIKHAILSYGAVNAAVEVDTAFMSYADGIFEDTFDTPSADPYYYQTTNHVVTLVGWDDNPPEGGEGYWILRNSWGVAWGEDGYMRIRYDSAAVNCAASFVVIEEQPATRTRTMLRAT